MNPPLSVFTSFKLEFELPLYNHRGLFFFAWIGSPSLAYNQPGSAGQCIFSDPLHGNLPISDFFFLNILCCPHFHSLSENQ